MCRLTATPLLIAFACGLLIPGCSPREMLLNKVANALSAEGGTVFTGDDDPQLVGDALPFALKMYESLLEQTPNHPRLLAATGKAFCMYAYAYVQAPADRLPDDQLDVQKREMRRAKKLYLRGRDYLLKALDVKHPGFKRFMTANKVDSALGLTNAGDTALLYWTAASWMGAFTAEKFDLGLMMGVPKAVAFMNKAFAYNEAFGEGSIHEFFISYCGAMPESMGGSEKKAREHFKRALELAHGVKAGPYVSLATSVSVKNQAVDEFRSLLEQALAVDVNASPQNRLANIMAQDKARWLLDNIDRFFLIPESQPEDSAP